MAYRFPVELARKQRKLLKRSIIFSDQETDQETGKFDDAESSNANVANCDESQDGPAIEASQPKKRTRKPRESRKKKNKKSEGIEDSNVNVKEKGFRVQGKHFLLTYMNINKTKEEILDLFKDKFHIVKGVFSEEIAPTTGTYHVHAVVKLPMKKDIRSPRYFDLDGFHPRIDTVKNGEMVNAVDYVIKKGNYKDYGMNSKAYIAGKQTKDELFYKVMMGEFTLKDLILCKPSYLTELKKIQKGLLEYWPILQSQGYIRDHQW